MNEHENLEFCKVDKISDDVYLIGFNTMLKFNVSLSKASNNKRYHFHKEYEYQSKLQGTSSLVTIKRSFDYYLSIESVTKDQNGNKVFIRIGPPEYFIFKQGLEQAIAWFTDKKYSKLFAKNGNSVFLTTPVPQFKIDKLPMQKYIELMPTIIDRGIASADKEPGVRMFMGSDSLYVDMNLERLMGLYYTISNFNMYQSALSVINYLGRPNIGTNRYVMETGYNPARQQDINESTIPKVSGIEGRFVTPGGVNNDISSLE